MQRLIRLVVFASNLAAYLACGVAVGMGVLVGIGVAARYIFNRPLTFVEEVGGYAMVAIVFLGLAYTARTEGHIRVDLVLGLVRPKLRKLLLYGSTALAILWAGALLGGGWEVSHYYYAGGFNSATTLSVPLWIPASVLIVGSILLVFQLLVMLVRPR